MEMVVKKQTQNELISVIDKKSKEKRKYRSVFQNNLHWARTRAVCHLLGKNCTSLESLFFSASIERSQSVISKIVIELQLFEWNKLADRLQAKRTLFINEILQLQKMLLHLRGLTTCLAYFRSIVCFVLCTNGGTPAILSRCSFQIPPRGWSWKKSSTTRQISFFVVNGFPHNTFFSSRNNQKSQGVTSVEYEDAEEPREIHPRWIWKWTRRCEHCRGARSRKCGCWKPTWYQSLRSTD